MWRTHCKIIYRSNFPLWKKKKSFWIVLTISLPDYPVVWWMFTMFVTSKYLNAGAGLLEWKRLVCCALLATALPSTHLTTKTLTGTICKIDAQHLKMGTVVQIHNIGEKSVPAPSSPDLKLTWVASLRRQHQCKTSQAQHYILRRVQLFYYDKQLWVLHYRMISLFKRFPIYLLMEIVPAHVA